LYNVGSQEVKNLMRTYKRSKHIETYYVPYGIR